MTTSSLRSQRKGQHQTQHCELRRCYIPRKPPKKRMPSLLQLMVGVPSSSLPATTGEDCYHLRILSTGCQKNGKNSKVNECNVFSFALSIWMWSCKCRIVRGARLQTVKIAWDLRILQIWLKSFEALSQH